MADFVISAYGGNGLVSVVCRFDRPKSYATLGSFFLTATANRAHQRIQRPRAITNEEDTATERCRVVA